MTTAEPLPKAPASESFTLPSTELAYKEVADALHPLRYDSDYREQFYGAMTVVRTELTEGDPLNGCAVFYKDERRQPSGSYKSRGASHAILQSPAKTYVTYSTGNHARSVGFAAAKVGASAVVEGTKSMGSTKVAGVLATGAELHNVHDDFPSAEVAARQAAEREDTVLIPPFGHPEVVAGQCTLGDELVEDLVDRGLAHETVIIPVSIAGGGHIAGVAIPVWEAKQAGRLGPNVVVVGVQPEGTDTMNRALSKLNADQEPVGLYAGDEQDKDCDALVIGEANLSPHTMTIVNDPAFVSGIFLVSKLEIARAMDALEQELGGDIEPAAALGRAFAEKYTQSMAAASDQLTTFVMPVSGGNVSPEVRATYRAVERQATRDAFIKLSNSYLARTVSGVVEALKAPQPTNEPKRVGSYALSGATAGYRTGLVEPERSVSRTLERSRPRV